MKTQARYPELIGLKLSRELADEIRRQAREDDRPVSAFLRRVLSAVIRRPSDEASGRRG